ncbi:MAG TPA: LysE family translocator [Streptomyces sp.]|uniref:LysE family translocator n=1 Tax=Streptomyces sp. TaxID=1931 RepID=UPI002D2FD4C9|nr:LysE family translocator [Streptomyces sp.]HZG03748.1 LysE family translocator [Streptomyces sp.]
MDAHLVAFTGVAAGMVALPGADFTVVVRNALTSRRAGIAAALGVAGGLLVHTALAVAGVAAVLVAVPALFHALRLLGGAYLLCLGVRALAGALRGPAGREGPAPRTAAVRGLREGFLTNVLNPKAPVLFLALLPQFVPDGRPVLPRTALLAGLVVALALLWFPAVALLVDRLGGLLRRPRAARTLDGLTGALLTALGTVLLCDPLF